MHDYIPRGEAGRIRWLSNFAMWLNAHGATHGFSPAEISAVNAAAADAALAVTNSATQQAAARVAITAKSIAITAALKLSRTTAKRLQSYPTTTDGDRAGAGITIPDTTVTAAPPDHVMTIPPPLLLLDFSVRRQVTIHWGPNPSNEHQNARPAGTFGCQIQAARGGLPTDEALWIPLDIDTESPLVHVVNETTPTTYAYRARYANKKIKYGPFGDPVVCTVSV